MEQYLVAHGPRIQQLEFDLADCKQRGMAYTIYYKRMKAIWDKLAIMNKFLCVHVKDPSVT